MNTLTKKHCEVILSEHNNGMKVKASELLPFAYSVVY